MGRPFWLPSQIWIWYLRHFGRLPLCLFCYKHESTGNRWRCRIGWTFGDVCAEMTLSCSLNLYCSCVPVVHAPQSKVPVEPSSWRYNVHLFLGHPVIRYGDTGSIGQVWLHIRGKVLMLHILRPRSTSRAMLGTKNCLPTSVQKWSCATFEVERSHWWSYHIMILSNNQLWTMGIHSLCPNWHRSTIDPPLAWVRKMADARKTAEA